MILIKVAPGVDLDSDVTMLALQQAGRHARDLGAFDSYCTVTLAESASTPGILAAGGK